MRKMIVVNYDKGFAEMLQHPAFRKSPHADDRTPTHGYAATPRGSYGGVR